MPPADDPRTRERLRLAARMRAIQPFHVMEIQRRAFELEAGGRRVIHMEIGQPDFPAPQPVVEAAIAALKHTPGGAFGSARYKLKGLEQNRAEYERLIEVFRAHDIGYFFYNGGGDSAVVSIMSSVSAPRMPLRPA